ncbi:MAG TPA: NADH-quinone oxidoreductase subunit J [Pirellulaceae bacterium]|jgi:NADH-quinone oxidoreductase subunit J|nr:NADH-quinone oxidoreductase subunit J [Pirellulaceae bacterium]
MQPFADWLLSHAAPLVGVTLGAVALWLALPRPRMGAARIALAAVAGLASLGILSVTSLVPMEDPSQAGLFYLFAGVAVVSGALTVTNHDPVYAALWFAIATLGVCGLFLLNFAPFLAAATVIVYAGAIIVTFLFILMLAQQNGAAFYDRYASRPLATSIAAGLVLATLLLSLHAWRGADDSVASVRFLPPPEALAEQTLSGGEEQLSSMRSLGRSLFGDYLFAVELAGTALLIAAIGAIAIAPRRQGGAL